MEARKEVQNLYDEPVTQPPSGIVDKIERSRKERYDRNCVVCVGVCMCACVCIG